MNNLDAEIQRMEKRFGTNQNNVYKPKILIIDDDLAIRTSVYDVLADRFDVKVTEDGEITTIDCIHDIKVILLDIKIPGKDGNTIFHELSDQYPHIPIIFFTALPDHHKDYRASKSLKPFGILNKGCSIKELIDVIENALRARK